MGFVSGLGQTFLLYKVLIVSLIVLVLIRKGGRSLFSWSFVLSVLQFLLCEAFEGGIGKTVISRSI